MLRLSAIRRSATLCVGPWLVTWWLAYWHLAIISWLFVLGLLLELVATAVAVAATVAALVIVWRHGLRAILVVLLAGLLSTIVAAAFWLPTTFAVVRYTFHRGDFDEIVRIAHDRVGDAPPGRTVIRLPGMLKLMSCSGQAEVENSPAGVRVFLPAFAGVPDEEAGFAHGGAPEEMVVIRDLPDGWQWVSTAPPPRPR